MITFGSLFAGIGGMDLGLERAGMTCRWQVEIDDYATRVLEKHWPTVQRYRDIRAVDTRELERVDLIAGGFPCQDISNAGKRAGIDGERSGLWSEFARIIRDLRPRYVLVENVAALLVRGIDRVLGDLAACGYDAEWQVIRASDCGVHQTRPRLFILAYERIYRSSAILYQNAFDVASNRTGMDVAYCQQTNAHNQDSRTRALPLRQYEQRTALLNDWRSRDSGRLSRWLDNYRGIGNSVVPQVAEWIGNRILSGDGPVT